MAVRLHRFEPLAATQSVILSAPAMRTDTWLAPQPPNSRDTEKLPAVWRLFGFRNNWGNLKQSSRTGSTVRSCCGGFLYDASPRLRPSNSAVRHPAAADWAGASHR